MTTQTMLLQGNRQPLFQVFLPNGVGGAVVHACDRHTGAAISGSPFGVAMRPVATAEDYLYSGRGDFGLITDCTLAGTLGVGPFEVPAAIGGAGQFTIVTGDAPNPGFPGLFIGNGVSATPLMADLATGRVLWREQLVWMARADSQAPAARPLPLVMLPEGNLYRDYAFQSLNRAGIPWWLAGESESLAGLQAMALADVAVTVLARAVSFPELAEVPLHFGLPALPDVPLVMRVRDPGMDQAVDRLAEYIQDAVGELAV